ncbi:hypothetical protein FHR71_004368 [Methylobacterium sp. RAS18]|nr:hypothetical protein [Methylobacterium sp. RAS18]
MTLVERLDAKLALEGGCQYDRVGTIVFKERAYSESMVWHCYSWELFWLRRLDDWLGLTIEIQAARTTMTFIRV